MDFGKLSDISKVDFSLPKVHIGTEKVLSQYPKTEKLDWQIGANIWSNPLWKGNLYPPKTKQADFLKFYAQKLSTLELNATFYRIFEPNVIEKWANQVPDTFKFYPKFNQEISHKRHLAHCEDLTKAFLHSISFLGDKLGVPFLQLPPNFSPDYAQNLILFIEKLPKEFKIAVEFRHRHWFRNYKIVEDVFALLESKNHTTIITDTSGKREVIHQRLTNDTLFLRFSGNRQHKTDYSRIDAWLKQIDAWQTQGLRKVIWIIHQPDEELSAPKTIEYIYKKLGLNFELYEQAEQGTLF